MPTFTEVTVRAGGNNLNAGTLDGVNEAATTPLVTYVSGTFVSATKVFTVASGNPISDGVLVGHFGAFDNGGALPAWIQRVTGRTATTVTFTSGGAGTMPPDGTYTVRIGGAWSGPSGAVSFPFGYLFLGNLTDSVLTRPRINLKNDQQYNVTATIAHNQVGPTRFQGYTATFGDGGKATVDGGTSGASYTLLTTNSSGSNIDLVDLIFSHNGATGSARGLTLSGPEFHIERCVFTNMKGDGFQSNPVAGNGIGVLTECEAYGNGVIGFGSTSAGDSIFDRCISHDNISDGFFVSGNATLINCVSDSNGGQGLNTSSVTGTNAINCEFYGNTGDGIRLNNSTASRFFFKNCNLVKNGGVGINGLGAGDRNGAVINCGFGSGTAANTSGTTTGLKSMTEAGSVNYPANVTPWVDPANGDFRINLAAARGTGRGAYTQTAPGFAGTVGSPDIGAAHVQSTLPAVGHVRSGDGFGVLGTEFTGTSILPIVGHVRAGDGFGGGGTEFTGTDVLPVVGNVVSGIGYGAGGTEFTGAYSAGTDYPAAGQVHLGTAYNFGALVGTRTDAAAGDVRFGTAYGDPAAPFVGNLQVPTYAVSGTTTDIESAVYRHLAATAAVTGLVGDRIYPNEADPDAPRPLIVFVLQGTEQTRSLLGGLDFQRHTVSVTADAIHKDDAKAVALAVRAALDNVTFDGIKRSYWADESAGETNDGYESVQTFTVIQ